MIKEKKSLKVSKSPSRRKFFKTAAATGVALKGLKSTGSADFNKVWSYLGTPCISLPLLQGENNLPLGIQVIGEKYDDNRFLGVSSWLEKESEKFNE